MAVANLIGVSAELEVPLVEKNQHMDWSSADLGFYLNSATFKLEGDSTWKYTNEYTSKYLQVDTGSIFTYVPTNYCDGCTWSTPNGQYLRALSGSGSGRVEMQNAEYSGTIKKALDVCLGLDSSV